MMVVRAFIAANRPVPLQSRSDTVRICSITPLSGDRYAVRVYEVGHSAASRNPNTAGLARNRLLSSASTTSMKLSEGIFPLAFHVEMALRLIPSRSAAADVPPSASMTPSTDLSMLHHSSRNENLSRFSFRGIDCSKNASNNKGMDPPEIVGKRLRLWTKAAGLTATKVCKTIKYGKGNWSDIVNGKERLPLDVADSLHEKFGLSLEWMYYGRPEPSFPAHLIVLMQEIEDEEARAFKRLAAGKR